MIITNEWVEENKGLVWTVVNKFAKEPQDEDLFQIAIMGAIESAPKYDTSFDVEFTTFIYECMRNALRTHIRKQITMKRGGQHTTTSLDDFESADVVSYRNEISEYNMENSIYIENILNDERLTPKQAEVMKLHVIDNMSFSEIAKLKNQSRQSIHSLFKYGVQRVKDKIMVA